MVGLRVSDRGSDSARGRMPMLSLLRSGVEARRVGRRSLNDASSLASFSVRLLRESRCEETLLALLLFRESLLRFPRFLVRLLVDIGE